METFKMVLQKSITTALSLKKKGVTRGDAIPICVDTHFNAIVSIIASTFIGAVPYLVSPTVSEDEIDLLLKGMNPKILFISDRKFKSFEKIVKTLNCRTEIILFDRITEHISSESILTFRNGENQFQSNPVENHKEVTCAIFYSTSENISKCVYRDHYYYFNSFYLFSDKAEEKHKENVSETVECFINYSSIIHDHLEDIFLSVLTGQCMLLCDSFSVDDFWKNIAIYDVSYNFFISVQ